MRRWLVNGWRGCGSRMTSLIVWAPKVMPDLITMRYEQYIVLLNVKYFNWMATGMYIWHATHSRRVVREDAYKEGRHLPEWAYTGPIRKLLINFTNISGLCVWDGIIQYMCILCWRHAGEDDARFIQWSCCHAERLRWHGALGTERLVWIGSWEAWVCWEGSAGWVERYFCSWDVFLV